MRLSIVYTCFRTVDSVIQGACVAKNSWEIGEDMRTVDELLLPFYYNDVRLIAHQIFFAKHKQKFLCSNSFGIMLKKKNVSYISPIKP